MEEVLMMFGLVLLGYLLAYFQERRMTELRLGQS